MKMIHKFGNKILLTLFVLVFVMLSCATDDECRQDTTVEMGMEFYRMKYSSSSENYVPVVDTLYKYVSGLDVDSLLLDSLKTTYVYVPLRNDSDNTSFVITSAKTMISDTLTVFYKKSESLVSLECGCVTYYNIIAAESTPNLIDSVVIENSDINLISQKNIRIYFR